MWILHPAGCDSQPCEPRGWHRLPNLVSHQDPAVSCSPQHEVTPLPAPPSRPAPTTRNHRGQGPGKENDGARNESGCSLHFYCSSLRFQPTERFQKGLDAIKPLIILPHLTFNYCFYTRGANTPGASNQGSHATPPPASQLSQESPLG